MSVVRITVFQTQFVIFGLTLLLRMASGGLLSLFGLQNWWSEAYRFGTDMATVAIVLLLVSYHMYNPRKLKFKGFDLFPCLIMISLLYVISYTLSRMVINGSSSNGIISISDAVLFIMSVSSGCYCLYISSIAVINADFNTKLGDKE